MLRKQLIPIFLLILILFHGALQLLVIKIFLAQHKKEMFLSIDNGTFEYDLILFKISKDDLEKSVSDIEWVEEDEFRIGREMYDVVDRKVKGDSIYLFCLHDTEESILYSTIAKIFNNLLGNEPNSTGNLTSITNFLSEFYFSKASELDKFYLKERTRYFPLKTFVLLDGEKFIDTPPPRF